MTKAIKVIAIVAVLFFSVGIAKAQFSGAPGSGGSGGSIPGSGSGGAVPFDGGLSIILIAAGAGIGARKKGKQQVKTK